jgi:hypothetical protein
MNREGAKKYYPYCVSRYDPVDMYSWPQIDMDSKYRTCENGTSHPIYSCNGDISYTLPLDMYPPDHKKIHPQIYHSYQPHFGVRDKRMGAYLKMMVEDHKAGRIEGFYM